MSGRTATLLFALAWSAAVRADAREAPEILRLGPAPAPPPGASALSVAIQPGAPGWWAPAVAALVSTRLRAPVLVVPPDKDGTIPIFSPGSAVSLGGMGGSVLALDAPDGVHHLIHWGEAAAWTGPSGIEVGQPAAGAFETATLDGGLWTDGGAPWVVAEGTITGGAHAVAVRSADSLEAQGYVRLDELLSGAVIRMRYTTADNFTGAALYPPGAACYLLPASAEALIAANRRLGASGARLLVYDCYRPLHVQRHMWAIHPVAGQVAPPSGRASAHNRGAAVDVGLVDTKGQPLLMPSPHDAFTPAARADATVGIPPEAIGNRARLHAALRAAGFVGISSEWWHYEGPDHQTALPRDAAFPDWAGPVPAK